MEAVVSLEARPWELTQRQRLAIAAKVLQSSKGWPLLVSMSGGKDSTATWLYLRLLGLDCRALHMDTGWEHQITEDYVRNVLPGIVGPIEIVAHDPAEKMAPERLAFALDLEARYLRGRPSGMVRRIIRFATFASRRIRWCTPDLKIKAFQGWAKENLDYPEFVNVVGVRAQESATRSGLPEWDMDDDGYIIWRPLIDWTEADVIDFHKATNTPPNRLYLRGASRVGCFPCVYSRKSELRWVAEMLPARINLIREMEEFCSRIAMEDAAEKGKPTALADGGPLIRSFFSNPRRDSDLRLNTEKALATGMEEEAAAAWAKEWTHVNMGIDDVIAWSKTKYGGREDEPFAPLPHETGCTRWGFCDVSWRDAQPPQADMFHKG